MDGIKGYLITVICAGIICAISCKLMESNGVNGALIKLLAGIIMTVALVMPVTQLDLSGINGLWDAYSSDAAESVSVGMEQTKRKLREGIKKGSEEYILKEAARLDLSITVSIQLSDNDPPVPVAVELSGDASPYAKSALIQSVCTAFDIEKENVQWT